MIDHIRADEAAVLGPLAQCVGGAVDADEPLAAIDRGNQSGALWIAERSPLVSANITTSVSDKPAALIRLRSSVGVTASPLANASVLITSRAVAIESCLKPAVAVSISTRIAGVVGAFGVGVGAVDVDDDSLHAQAHASARITHA